MRRSHTPVVPPSMYRHFAVVTVLLTAILAMFAEGESRQAQAAPAARQAPARPAAPSIVATRQTPPSAPDWWGVDSSSGSDNGAVTIDTGASAGFEDLDAPGYSSEYVASLSEDERELLIAGTHESGMTNSDDRDSRSAALAAASSHRSGSASMVD